MRRSTEAKRLVRRAFVRQPRVRFPPKADQQDKLFAQAQQSFTQLKKKEYRIGERRANEECIYRKKIFEKRVTDTAPIFINKKDDLRKTYL